MCMDRGDVKGAHALVANGKATAAMKADDAERRVELQALMDDHAVEHQRRMEELDRLEEQLVREDSTGLVARLLGR